MEDPRQEQGEAGFTALLRQSRRGDDDAAGHLVLHVYRELRARAASYLRGERPGHTLQPSDLAHEAYLKLAGGSGSLPRDRAHFLAIAARTMRQILVDHARRRRTTKRGGDADRIALDDTLGMVDDGQSDRVDLLDLDRKLDELASLHERQARVVELRFFSGLTIAECGEVLGVSTDTVEDDWAVARAWLRRALRSG